MRRPLIRTVYPCSCILWSLGPVWPLEERETEEKGMDEKMKRENIFLLFLIFCVCLLKNGTRESGSSETTKKAREGQMAAGRRRVSR